MGELKSFVKKGTNIEELFKDYEIIIVIEKGDEDLVIYKSNYGRVS